MPSFNTHLLPSTTGLTLGSQIQQWNLWANLINGAQPVTFASAALAYSASPSFVAAASFSAFSMTLLGNVGSSTFAGIPGLVVFQFTQDGIGGRSFVWPTNLLQGTTLGKLPNQVTTQIFYFDGTNGWPVGPGVINP